jgi:hypothetical protein
VNTFVVETFVTYRRVTYYTVRWDESELSETDKFFSNIIETRKIITKIQFQTFNLKSIKNHGKQTFSGIIGRS